MIEQASVKSVNNNIAILSVKRKSACGNCNACGFTSGSNEANFEAENTVNARLGDTVEIEVKNKNLALSIIIIYVIPLLMFGLGLILGKLIGGEVIQFLCAINLFIFALVLCKLLDKKLAPIVIIKSIIK